ncbi:RDD family protein [Halobacillus yeomjeoni]|uniref:RDD family protein n=1 Tax=Halobacillus yeomjeoni TaxID=311194 RepID=UPI001CD2EF5B|nr:RDD family protein [Halobacillus yeomjeoni]MCA0982873.1 RDD family protein [Halobacillus yeomjeoni]
METQKLSKHIPQRLIGGMFEIILSGVIGAIYTEMQNTGRGYDPNPAFWKAFLIAHLIIMIVVPLLFRGKTIGILITNMDVVSNKGKRIRYYQILSRAILGFGVVAVTHGAWFFVSMALSLMDKRGRGWSEFISHTTIKPKEEHEL